MSTHVKIVQLYFFYTNYERILIEKVKLIRETMIQYAHAS